MATSDASTICSTLTINDASVIHDASITYEAAAEHAWTQQTKLDNDESRLVVAEDDAKPHDFDAYARNILSVDDIYTSLLRRTSPRNEVTSLISYWQPPALEHESSNRYWAYSRPVFSAWAPISMPELSRLSPPHTPEDTNESSTAEFPLSEDAKFAKKLAKVMKFNRKLEKRVIALEQRPAMPEQRIAQLEQSTGRMMHRVVALETLDKKK